ncbi:hypothetical protein DXG03_003315 [Asterophora parasitica]|uniref:F-box domain-containing protein n=1 Tax=Asterophora parasitica TaxID=117018 RepID=A0A9P7G9J9_9AGAR|nr:hypothetical protein DXG03_003315 [Asterophora parasitica]
MDPPQRCSIGSLPPELLIQVFEECAINHPLAPLTLRTVSKWWTAIVDHSPRVWRHITLHDSTHSIPFLRQQAELWAERSLSLPLNVELKVENIDLILPMLSPLLSSVHRWHSFEMKGAREETRIFSDDLPVAGRSLDCLQIWVDAIDDASSRRTFEQDKELVIMNIWCFELPKSTLLAPLCFTAIVIKEDTFSDLHSQPEDILDFLTACPALQTFYFHGYHYNDEPPARLPVITLSHLHTLQLKNTCMTRAILSSLHTPQLVNLHLAHLNVEFALRGQYSDEGDSADEAADFSQSPWSDHATGMGLRKLITRSRPPLVTLNMDFSDMRTKDFNFVFDRLPFLQHFLIVASDMSDTVIQLLRPYTLDGVSRVRLPRLSSLALHNCQRLSGQAVVDALKARVGFTDTRPLGTSTLKDVAIQGCDGFGTEHEHMLLDRLGARLRLA